MKRTTTRTRSSASALPKRTAGAPVVQRGPVIVTRKAHFNAAHRLHNPSRSDKWNRDQFGPCNHPNWHGHNYELEVSVIGVPDAHTGYVIDLGKLRDVIQREILDACDHRNLNLDVPFLKGVIPSSENLAIVFWERLAPHITGGHLWRVRLFETERNWVDYHGPQGPAALMFQQA